ncbi:unnamed protein product [Sphagnum troendelagicum]|jgi:hypothetical protein
MDSESKAEEFEEQAIQDIKQGKLKVLNSDGTFRCPFSPNKKQRSYKFSEILQHAEGVQKGKQGMEAAGKHQALLRHLKQDHKERAQPQAEQIIYLDQTIPSRVEKPRLVIPHMGILLNIKNTYTCADGFHQGPGQREIAHKLKVPK